MMTIFKPCAVLTLALLTLHNPVVAQEWTRFRGPNGSGHSDVTTVPNNWTADDVNWKVKLPGEGHGSPVIWGRKLFLQSADPKTARRHVICINTDTGKLVWDKAFDSTVFRPHKFNNFGSSTPAVDQQHVYVYWTTPAEVTLMALTHAGEVAWRQNLGPFDSQHGGGTSPILYDGLVIITNDQQGDSFVAAFNAKTGKPVWQHARPGAPRSTAYSVPSILARLGKPDELIVNSKVHGITSLNPKTGAVNWELSESDGAPLFRLRSVSSSVAAGGLVIGSCGSGGGGNYVVAVRPPAEGKGPALAWKITRAAPYVPTPLPVGDLLYLLSDGGMLTCVTAATGDIHYRERVPGNYFGSPVCVGDHIYAINTSGEVIVVKAGKSFELVATIPLGEKSHATPAIAHGRMYLRTLSHLTSVGGKSRN